MTLISPPSVTSSSRQTPLAQIHCPIREAELPGVLLALTEKVTVIWASHSYTLTHLHIFCYYQDVVGCLRSPRTSLTLQKIHSLTRELERNGIKVTITWIPSHQGIPGNEKAHESLRESLNHFPARDSALPTSHDSTERFTDHAEEIIFL